MNQKKHGVYLVPGNMSHRFYFGQRRDGGAEGHALGAPMDPLSIISTGLQEELGLKLESRKTPIDLLIVDHAEKVPVEN